MQTRCRSGLLGTSPWIDYSLRVLTINMLSIPLQKCIYERRLHLAEFPEMVFPHNLISIGFANFAGCSISFNALDALLMVDAENLPDVQVVDTIIAFIEIRSLHL